MQHPVLKSKKNLYRYVSAWVPVVCTHACIDVFFYALPPSLSLFDAVVSTVLFAGIGLLAWYTVRFISLENQRIPLQLFNHFMAAGMFISLWYVITKTILIHSNTDIGFIEFIEQSGPFRIVIASFVYCILALSYYLYKYYNSYKVRIEREAAWKTQATESELNLLKSQLQPHFIFNSLNSVHALLLQDVEKAQHMLSNLSGYLRLSIEKNKEKSVPFSEEIKNALLYYSIEKIRFENRMHIETHIEDDTMSSKVPFMIIQPLLENSIRHALFESLDPVTIELNGFIKENALHIVIRNNHDRSVKKQFGSGLGLKHVQQRLFLLFGRKNLMKIKDENGIFQVELTIPQY